MPTNNLRWSNTSVSKVETLSTTESYHTCSDPPSPEQAMNVNYSAGNDYSKYIFISFFLLNIDRRGFSI